MESNLYDYCKNFASNLKNERKSQNYTQKQMAEKIGIKVQSYQAYESGLTQPTVLNLLKISQILNVSLDDLFEIKN